MKHHHAIYMHRSLFIFLMMVTGTCAMAQTDSKATPVDSIDVLMARIDSLTRADSVMTIEEEPVSSVLIDSTRIVKPKRDWNTWRPDPKRALWLALVLPGAGQIYNRKYWKLPIIYGGFIGCIYALTWNNMMYKDYSQAYLDLMDNDPGTASYNKFLHLGVEINSTNEERYKEIFKNRKDKYRRWRDLSIFVMIGVYALSVIDAYVDAELSAFDISKDLSLKVEPTVIPNHGGGNPLQAQSLGVNCKLNF
ncbi:hypothetical protein SAMN04487852_107119 [Prevotella sp. tf2-5]|nr:DUF5683 domain-containing protein [Prevotella sp. tf2-5]SFO78582.1 hypothetical protein SAMN04487852_107119 [Prevotella sp. tf2-5]